VGRLGLLANLFEAPHQPSSLGKLNHPSHALSSPNA
jgi:hypothetical protein